MLYLYEEVQTQRQHYAMVYGDRHYSRMYDVHRTHNNGIDPEPPIAPLVRLHSECFTGETLHSKRCDCGDQLDQAMRRCSQEGGAIVYLRQEGRGIGLEEKLKSVHIDRSFLLC